MPIWQKITFALGLSAAVSIVLGYIVVYILLYGIAKLALWHKTRER